MTPAELDALIVRMRAEVTCGCRRCEALRAGAAALEGFAKMQPVAWRIPGWRWQDMRNDPPAQVDGIEYAYAVPLYRKGE
jgi:hypothetical protein